MGWLKIQYGSTVSQSEGHFHVGKAIDQSGEGLCLQFTPPPPGAERSYLHYLPQFMANKILGSELMLEVICHLWNTFHSVRCEPDSIQ